MILFKINCSVSIIAAGENLSGTAAFVGCGYAVDIIGAASSETEQFHQGERRRDQIIKTKALQ